MLNRQVISLVTLQYRFNRAQAPLIAFSQQATQLIGTFSMLATSTRAIMAFSALGVIVPVVSAVAGAFLRTRDAAEESSGSVDLLTKSSKPQPRQLKWP